ncbi:phospholipase D-like domain-containing protein [Ruegeria denitrificans]|uniref:phospholipase D-like domain-containing protein n=1 Tax=Ruegeria denitrificans TaxID=1715692 RepID=UPI00147BD3E5
MTLVRVALPVLQGTKKFIIDKGRPWTVIEHALLASISLNEQSFDELQKNSELPRRVLVESVVRLMRVGWVELHDAGSKLKFGATPSGKAAATLKELPSPLTRHTQRRSFVIDQITGTVFRRRQMPFHHTHYITDLEERGVDIVRLERPEKENVGEVSTFLNVLFEEDEQFVAFEGGGERLMERWALISVRDQRAEGLPSHAPEELVRAIEGAAKAFKPRANARAPQYTPAQFRVTPPKLNEVKARFSASDLVIGGPEHREVLRNSIRKARHRIVLHSTFISEHSFRDVFGDLRVALDRGAQIDILWGQSPVEGSSPSREAANKIRSEISSSNIDRLRIHPSSTQSHSKILIADRGQPTDFDCYIGSCNWLYSGFQSFEASVKIQHNEIIAELLCKLSDMCRSPNGHFSSRSEEYLKLATILRKKRTDQSGSSRIAVVSGLMHSDLIRRARDEVSSEAFVCSHRISPASGPLVLSAMVAAASQEGRLVKIFFGRTSGGLSADKASALIRDDSGTGVDVRPVYDPRLHAKVLAWDTDNLVITSQNWLSADPPPDKPLSEIGLFIQSKNIASNFKERFRMSLKS